MTNKLYLGVGHGVEPNGVFDPGATHENVREYDLAFYVANRVGLGLAGIVDFYTEVSSGKGHDPDYRGSVEGVNNGGYAAAIEIHFDYDQAERGGMGLWLSSAGAQWTERIAHEYGVRSLPFRGNVQRPDLWFLKGTKCPAIIWECDRVGLDVNEGQLDAYADAIVKGTLAWYSLMGWPVNSPSSSPQPSQPVHNPAPHPQAPAFPGRLIKLTNPWMTGQDVEQVQERLIKSGAKIKLDGYYGTETKNAVVNFQRFMKIGVDGIVGKNTWNALWSF